jgi:hypothetical protein
MEKIMGNSLWNNSRKWIDIEWCLLYAKKGCNDRVFTKFHKSFTSVFKKNPLDFRAPVIFPKIPLVRFSFPYSEDAIL